jgi:hypothetical protein
MFRDGEQLLFRAVCTCGWMSKPVDAGATVHVWIDHTETPSEERPPNPDERRG